MKIMSQTLRIFHLIDDAFAQSCWASLM